jgi:hypothetical protein
MREWGMDPDWILDNWSMARLELMVRKSNERWRRQSGEDQEQPATTMADLRRAQAERFEVWKEMTGGKKNG